MDKSPTLCMRLKPKYKDMLVKLAQQNNRSITNMIEVLITDYYKQHAEKDK